MTVFFAATEAKRQQEADEENRDWDEIIPESFRKKMDEEDKMREIEDLYLPPRRKTQVQGGGNNATATTSGSNNSKEKSSSSSTKKRKLKSEPDPSEEEEISEESDNEERPRKRGRPSNKERLLNFTDAELRRFIKSYKKFPAPLKRLESIAVDADLQEKPMREMKKLGELLRKRCVAFMADHKDVEPPANEVKKRGARAGFSVKFGGASFNAKTLWTCEEELRPLDEVVPNGREERLRWTLDYKTRPASFDVDWGLREDSRLLAGIYQYGMGSWEAMKADVSLELSDKILTPGELKPQAKHLQTRAEYLLKVIRKNLEMRKNGKKTRKPRKNKEKAVVVAGGTSAIMNNSISGSLSVNVLGVASKDGDQSLDDISSSNDEKKATPTAAARKEMMQQDPLALTPMDVLHHHNQNSNNSLTMDENSRDGFGKAGKSSSSKSQNHHHNHHHSREGKREKKKSKGNAEGPMHFTANNEPRALTVLGDLDPNVFNECKEKMRPVKKALKALDNPDQSLSTQDQVAHTTDCLLRIGKQIDECLKEYSESPERVKEWRSNLWYFVSKFTEFDAKKLFKLYKRALKKSMDEGGEEERSGGGGGGVGGDEEEEGEVVAGSSGHQNHHTSNGGGGGSDGGDAKEMKSFNRKSSNYREGERRSEVDGADVKKER